MSNQETTQPQTQDGLLQPPSSLSIRLQSPSGLRTITLSMPTREHWIARQAKRPVLVRSMGRKQETTIREAPDQDLRILLDILSSTQEGADSQEDGRISGPPLEAYEASHILSRLALANFYDIEPEEEHFKVSIETVVGIFSPILRIPTLKEVQQYQSSRSRTLSAGRLTEVYINLQAGEVLFDKCFVSQSTSSKSPYPMHEPTPLSAYPIIWKAAAASALVDEMDNILTPDPSEDLFRP